jgi:chromosome segregation ATPase
MDAPVDASDLQAAVRRAQLQGDLDEQLLRAGGELQRIEEQAVVDLQRLPLWTGAIEDLEKLAVPVAETIEQYDSRMTEATNRLTVLDERLEEHRGRCLAIEQELKQLKLEHDVPTEEDLAAAREQRDRGWTHVRRAWLDDVIDGDPHDVAQAYEVSVEAADRIADRLRGEAESVAGKAKLIAQQQEEEKRIGELEADETEARTALESLEESWRGVWAPLGIEPLTPREMRSWSARHADLVRLATTGRQQRMDVRQLRTLIDSHRQELNECLTRLGAVAAAEGDCLSAVVQRCEDLILRTEADANERQTLRREVEGLEGRLPAAEREAEQARAARKAWRDQWSQAVECLGLDQDASPDQANAVLNAIDEFTARLKEADNLRDRIEAIDRDAATFAQAVAQLTGQIATDLSDLPAERAVADLYDRLSSAVKGEAQREELKKQFEREEQKRDKATTEIGQCEAAVEVMRGEAGCDTADHLPEAERRSVRRQELERDLEQLNEQLAILAAGATLEAFIQEAESCDPDQLQPMIDRLAGEIAQLDAESSQVSETIGSERTEQSRMDGNARAAESQEDAERLAAQVRSDAAQYVRLRLASAVLGGAITRYREKNKGPVLERASDLFAELTDGSFAALRADYDEKGEAVLVGVRPGGQQVVGVGGLSDGTESQLYLALRLAVLEIAIASREPVPFIVDDILKDFDDNRSVAALKALAQLSGQTQVILFTHHYHLVRLAEAHLDPDVVFTHVLEAGAPVGAG